MVTSGQGFACRLDFDEGLNLIRADNSRGKTTILTSILYALGWEGMLGPGRAAPFTQAVTEVIAFDGDRLPVLESFAIAELQGEKGDVLSARRAIRSESEKTELVRTWQGAVLTEPGLALKETDYYVRAKWAAQNEAGYQRRLAEFIGWSLPEVATWDGGFVPLYSEVVAPFLYVEQTMGWAWIASVMPRYLKVREPEQRATEFLLGLDALTRSRERDGLIARRDEARGAWRMTVESFAARVADAGGRLENLPTEATSDWPPTVEPMISILHRDQWTYLDTLLTHLRTELSDASDEIPSAEEGADEASEELTTAERRVSQLGALQIEASRDLVEQNAELQALKERIEALRKDRSRYDDAIRLQRFGSSQGLAFERDSCPTCEQPLPTTLLGVDVGPAMSLEDNRSLIDEEIRTFEAMEQDAAEVLLASRQRHSAIRSELNETRRTIRMLKRTLTQNAAAPSQAEIAKRIRLADRIEAMEDLRAGLVSLVQDLADQSSKFRLIVGELAELGTGGGLNNSDQRRLAAFADLIRDLLAEFGFSGVPPAEIEIAPDNYLPMTGGAQLRAEPLSASDRVRMVWAYVVGLLEFARDWETPHPGLLVLDEPGQQEVNDASLGALLRRVARSADHGQQVIVATSKPTATLQSMLADATVELTEIDGYALAPG